MAKAEWFTFQYGRLKTGYGNAAAEQICVYIPIWTIKDELAKSEAACLTSFTFQYGRLKTYEIEKNNMRKLGLHSNMDD